MTTGSRFMNLLASITSSATLEILLPRAKALNPTESQSLEKSGAYVRASGVADAMIMVGYWLSKLRQQVYGINMGDTIGTFGDIFDVVTGAWC